MLCARNQGQRSMYTFSVISQMKTSRHTVVKSPARGDTAAEQQSWDVNMAAWLRSACWGALALQRMGFLKGGLGFLHSPIPCCLVQMPSKYLWNRRVGFESCLSLSLPSYLKGAFLNHFEKLAPSWGEFCHVSLLNPTTSHHPTLPSWAPPWSPSPFAVASWLVFLLQPPAVRIIPETTTRNLSPPTSLLL